MINPSTLDAAIAEAKRFIGAAEQLKVANVTHHWTNPKENGACKRASMDLTRKLADLRQGR